MVGWLVRRLLRDLLKIRFFFFPFFFFLSRFCCFRSIVRRKFLFKTGIKLHEKDVRYKKGREEERERKRRFMDREKKETQSLSFNIVKFYSFHRISFKNKIIRKKRFLRFLRSVDNIYICIYITCTYGSRYMYKYIHANIFIHIYVYIYNSFIIIITYYYNIAIFTLVYRVIFNSIYAMHFIAASSPYQLYLFIYLFICHAYICIRITIERRFIRMHTDD